MRPSHLNQEAEQPLAERGIPRFFLRFAVKSPPTLMPLMMPPNPRLLLEICSHHLQLNQITTSHPHKFPSCASRQPIQPHRGFRAPSFTAASAAARRQSS